MRGLLGRFVNLPRPAQIVIGALCAGSLITAVLMLGRFSGRLLGVILLGLIFVAVLLILYRFALKQRQKRKADPFEREVKESSGAVPQSITDVSDRARLDEMRTKFEKGVATFRQHGKDLYSLPWYVLIGEPGSGKTEAVRHCGVGFPPGLQDQLQGTGGTINMDWWFTNHAVLLDTAGRLIFGEEHSTDTREWAEFLRLLKKNRPNCPINGLLLFIPVDSLIQDDADELERKGGRLARQLDLIQRSLGVRFPVSIIVAKADKLTGFRQFFRELRDPQLQHQILGWSNPASLDEPFDPALVDEHLVQVTHRLMRRRLTRLLGDSTSGEEPSGRRTDQVDELYAFPAALQRLSSRLRRYLELIFVGGEWSSKPLFLRGIYFTSSMQHGEALDAELAEALGVAVESLHEAAWTEDRAYFLRDVLMEKVFREQGLVTDATNTATRLRKRRGLLIGAGGLASLIFAGLIIWAVSSYRTTLGEQHVFWTELKDEYLDARSERVNHDWKIVRQKDGDLTEPYVYMGDSWVGSIGSTERTLVELFPMARDKAEATISVPLAFWIPAVFTGEFSLSEERREACRALFEEVVIAPLVRAAVFQLKKKDIVWSDDAATALANLIDILASPQPPQPRRLLDDERLQRTFSVEPMLRFALAQGAPDEFPVPKVYDLQNVCDWLYAEGRGDREWPSPQLRETVDLTQISHLVTRFSDDWQDRLKGEAGELGKLEKLRQALEEYSRLEDELLMLEIYEQTPQDLKRSLWESRFAKLAKAKPDVDDRIERLKGGSLLSSWKRARQQLEGGVQKQYDLLLAAALGKLNADIRKQSVGEVNDFERRLRDGWGKVAVVIAEDIQGKESELAHLDQLFLASAPLGGESLRFLDLRFSMYEVADGLLSSRELLKPQFEFGQASARLTDIDQKVRVAGREISDLAHKGRWPSPQGAASETKDKWWLNRAVTVAKVVVSDGLAGLVLQQEVAQGFLRDMQDASNGPAIAEMVADQAKRSGGEFQVPRVPLTRLFSLDEDEVKGEHEYHPEVAGALFADWAAVHPVTADGDHASRTSVKGVIGDYAWMYIRYWTEEVIGQLKLDSRTWRSFQVDLEGVEERQITEKGLNELAQVILEALEGLKEGLARRGNEDGKKPNLPFDDHIDEKIKEAIGYVTNARRLVDDDQVRGNYKTVLRSWQRLDNEEAQKAAARVILELKHRKGQEYFVESKEKGLQVFINQFWSDFSVDALAILEDEVVEDALEAYNKLQRSYRKFPLAPLEPDVDQLTQVQVDKARSLVNRAFKRDYRPTNGGGQANDWFEDIPGDRAKDLVQRLLTPLDDQQTQELDTLSSILEALPTKATGPFHATVHVLRKVEPSSEDNTVAKAADVWRFLQLSQGQRKGAPKQIRGVKDVKLGMFQYPGGDIGFEFRKTDAQDLADKTVRFVRRSASNRDHEPVFSGHWALLEMLADCQTVQPLDCSKKAVKLELLLSGTIGRETKEYSLWLELIFKEKSIPLEAVELWRSRH